MELPDLAAIHDRYLDLACAGRSAGGVRFPGKLLLRAGFDPEGITVLVAASVAGAASLCIDADADALRAGLRAGFCDFIVNHLDEALRILKNEIRQSRAVAVGLSAPPDACFAEIAERGLQPDFLSLSSPEPQAARTLLERGSRPLTLHATDPHTSPVQWSVSTEPARSLRAIAGMAVSLLDPNRADTAARRHWLELSPAYLGRAFGPRQCVRMTGEESVAFRASLRERFPAASVTVQDAEN